MTMKTNLYNSAIIYILYPISLERPPYIIVIHEMGKITVQKMKLCLYGQILSEPDCVLS